MASPIQPSATPFLTTAALALVALALSGWLYSSAFDDKFRCDYLIVDGVDAPQFMCDGADIGAASGVAGAVDSVANVLGLGDDESVVGDALTIPGLSGLIDGPLDVVRRIGVIAGLLLLVAASATITWVQRHLRHVLRLLRFDRDAWQRSAETGRTFLSIYLALLIPVVIVAIVV